MGKSTLAKAGRTALLALGSGGVMGLTMAPTHWWVLAWLAQAPLWVLIYGGEKRSQRDRSEWKRLPLNAQNSLLQNSSFQHLPSKVHDFGRSLHPVLAAMFWGIGYYGTTLRWVIGLHPLTWMGLSWIESVAIALTCWCIVVAWGCVWVGLWAMGLWVIIQRWLPIGQVGHIERINQIQQSRIINPIARTEKIELTKQYQTSQTESVFRGFRWLWFGWIRILVGTALWCGLDTLWSHSILYWPTLALTQSPNNLWVLQINQLSGPVTTTAVIVAVNGLIAEAWVVYQQDNRANDGLTGLTFRVTGLLRVFQGSVGRYLAVAMGLAAIAHLLGLWLYVSPSPFLDSGEEGTNSTSMMLKIGLIQGNIPTRIKLTGLGVRQAWERYSAGYDWLADQGADVIVMPEGALPVIWQPDEYWRNPVVNAISDRQVPAIIGTFVPTTAIDTFPERMEKVDGLDTPPHITQSLVLAMPVNDSKSDLNGMNVEQSDRTRVMAQSQYNKTKLVPLGEYIPGNALLGAIIQRLSPISSSMVPGDAHQIFQTQWGTIIAGICYESAFADLFRRQTLAGGEWILTASNNDPYSGTMMAQHHAQDVMRAIENDRWTVRVTNTGYSGLVTPHGKTVWRSQRNRLDTYLAVIQRRQSQTVYVRWGNWITPLLLGSSLVAILGISWQWNGF